jgi:soluble lytic murein transglycosylase-like protein
MGAMETKKKTSKSFSPEVSGGDAKSVSSKAAIGLMQLMPATYAELRTRYGLGADPFDPHDNILAGAAYLRELLDQYGERGFLAAYNAGPERYEHYLRGRSLPAETTDYVRRIAPAHSAETPRRLMRLAPAPVLLESLSRSPSPKGTTISR